MLLSYLQLDLGRSQLFPTTVRPHDIDHGPREGQHEDAHAAFAAGPASATMNTKPGADNHHAG